MTSLWGEEFNIEPIDTKEKTKKTLDKVKNPKTPKVAKTAEQLVNSKNVSLEEKLTLIKENVESGLSVYKDMVAVVDMPGLTHYIGIAIEKGFIAIDTETDHSLDPFTCKLMGACLYTPGERAVYVPVNHHDYKTGIRYDWQCDEAYVKKELDRLAENNVKVIMHNADFDYRVIYCTCNCDLDIYWDTATCARILNENERAALKWQYMDKIDPSVGKYSVDTFFKDVDYADVDVNAFALYAATDAYITYRLFEYQLEVFKKPEFANLARLFNEVEMPIIKVVSHMELNGMKIDKPYAKVLADKYHAELDKADQHIADELNKLKPAIDKWRMTEKAQYKPMSSTGKPGKSLSEKLQDPVAVTSPTQLAILLYDVLQFPAVDKKAPRATGEDVIVKLTEKYDFTLGKAILEKRGLEKLLGTYIEKIPAETHDDDRIRASINPLGADTGRFSISNPSLQNIPSHHKEVRLMFEASPGYAMVGGDYSQQEPRLLAALSGDKSLIDAYVTGRDLYSTVASLVYNNSYEDNKEFRPDGSLNPEGKKRRSNCKSIVLGLLYGRGTASVAEQIGTPVKEAQELVDKFFNAFPTVRDWIEGNKNHAREKGYVEGIIGRRRRLPDIQLPKFVITPRGYAGLQSFNPLLNTSGEHVDERMTASLAKYEKQLMEARSLKQKNALKEELDKQGYDVRDNGGFIAQAERQSTNAIIQGSAATLTKIAMIAVHNDPELKALGFRMLLCIHDEILGECPIENSSAVAERLSYLMIEAAKPVCEVPMKVDTYEVSRWYLDEIAGNVRGKYEKNPTEETKQHIYEEYDYINREALDSMMDGTINLLTAKI